MDEYVLFRRLAKNEQAGVLSTDSDIKTIHPFSFYARNCKQLPRLSIFFEIILSIVPTQVENERDFSIEGVFNSARRASMTVDTIATLMYSNKNLSNTMDSLVMDDEAIQMMEQFLEENNEIEEINETY